MPDYSSHFYEERGPEPWAEDGELIEYLVRWLETTCLLKGHELRPAVRIADPEKWRTVCAKALAAGRNRDTIAIRDDVLRAIEQVSPGLAEKLPEPQENLETPDVNIAESTPTRRAQTANAQ